jgi:hypothetical protein
MEPKQAQQLEGEADEIWGLMVPIFIPVGSEKYWLFGKYGPRKKKPLR